MFNDRPLKRTLSGLSLEYRIIQIYSRDAGKREAKISFNVGQGTQDLGFRSDVDILFQCEPAVTVVLDVRDEDGKPTMASFIFRDRMGRVYPSPSRRLAPDFFFHPQIYRQSGETVALPPGHYEVEVTRGPEYLVQTRTIDGPQGQVASRDRSGCRRWINLAKMDWFSGDHHVHAAGCGHYESPTEGVKPEDMWRHILGEDLDVGCVLSWGPCWYAQKQFFEGKIHPLSTPEYLMRYDVEVSGFPSSHAGHLCLLRLKEDDYPGTTRIEEWPSWDLPVLKWGKSQGGVVGFSHSGWGLKISDDKLPSYEVPPFDGIGANEYIVDVVHDAVDFISTVDTPAPWELNIWYHTLNCGYRAKISGETDFPCIYGERVGLGRVYVKLADGQLDFDRWCEGIKQGRSYVTDGQSHLIDFRVDDRGARRVGQRAEARRPAHRQGDRPGRRLPRPDDLGRGPRDPRSRRSTRSPTGTSSAPGSARPARSPSRWSSTASPSPRPRSRPTATSRASRSTCRSRSRAGSRCGSTRRRTPTRSSSRRRQADPGVEEIGRVVPEVGRPVLVAEGAGHPRRREGGRQEGVRRRPRRLQEDPRGERGGLRASANRSESFVRKPKTAAWIPDHLPEAFTKCMTQPPALGVCQPACFRSSVQINDPAFA